jgi:putative transposase
LLPPSPYHSLLPSDFVSSDVLNREVFFGLKEAKVLIEKWRQKCDTIQPHSSLNGTAKFLNGQKELIPKEE